MAITSAIMQMRRGLEADFDPDKMHPGEWAVSTDERYVRMCFSPGVCVRMATYDAFEEDMAKIEEILSTCETIEEAVSKINTEVSTSAQAVAEYTEQAKKYRDEAKKFRDEAESITGIGIATKDKAGIVKPDGTTITVDEDGTIHSAGGGGTTNYSDLENKPKINGVVLSGNRTLADLKITTADSKDNTVTFSQADTREKILSNEKHSTLFGKIAKWLSDLKTVAFSGSYSDLSNKPSSLDTYEEIMANTESGKFAGVLGVQEGFETLTNSLNTLIVNIGANYTGDVAPAVTIQPNSYAIFTIPLNVPQGYKPIIFSRIDVVNAIAFVMGHRIDSANNIAYVVIGNPLNAEINTCPIVDVICMKSQFVGY